MWNLQGQSQIIQYDERLKLVHRGKTTYADGKPVQGESVESWIDCNVQPVNGRDLEIVPEGDRFKEQYWVFTIPQAGIQVNDQVIREDVNFEVQSVEHWGSYSLARIMRIDVGPDATP